MKKFLSLVLALVMTMSLVTVSAGAKDFTDGSKINYKEAVDVMSAAKVIDGYAEGDFRPTNTLTRGAAAKIICNLILGPTTASALVADAAPYKDVPTTNTFAGYIAYCQKEGIISGYADGTFRPGNSLTGYAFMKMLLGALGYDSETEGYTGNNWSIQVAKRALNIGLDDDLVGDFNGVKAVNREEACLYAFNTLKATMVEYDNNNSVTVNGITFTNKSAAKEMANTGKTDGYIDNDGKMQFAEKYFDKLRGESDSDNFGRPATKWKYDGSTVGTYADSADTTYVVADAEKSLGTLMTDGDYLNYAAKDVLNAAKVYRNGKQIGTYQSLNANKTVAGKGDIIEAFENSNNDVDTIVVRSYTYAKIDDVDTNLSKSVKTKGASVGIDLVDIDDGTIGTWYDDHDDGNKVLNGFSADTYTKGTSIAVAISEKDNKTIIDSYVLSSVSGKPSKATEVAVNNSLVKGGNVTIDGTKYNYAAKMTGLGDGENVDFDEEYTIYLTAEGYVIAIDGTAMATMDDVYYITGTYMETSKGVNTYFAQAVKITDGSVTDLKLDVDKNKNAGDITVTTKANGEFDPVGGLYVMDEDDNKYTGTAYKGQDRYSVVEGTLTQDVTRTSTALRFEANTLASTGVDKDTGKAITEKCTRLYLDSTTFFIAVEDKAADLDVKTATGIKTIDKDTVGLKVYAIYKDGEDDAAFVVYAAKKLNNAVNKDDVVYLTDDASTKNSDGYVVDLFFMNNMTLSENVTIDKDGKTAQGFYVFSEDDGVYELKTDSSNKMTDKEVDSKSEGYVTGVTFDSTKNNTASSKDNVFTAVSFANATVMDTRGSGDKKADIYSSDIDSVSALSAAIKKGDVKADVYVENGKIIFVAVTECENDDPTNTNGSGSSATTGFSESGSKIIYTLEKGAEVPSTLKMTTLVKNYVAAKYDLELDSLKETNKSSGSEATYIAVFGGAEVTVEVVYEK